tara:strand:- start:11161 stop:12402 length:1242 start_codon:yes stop_codon:yes gene_type:complete
MAENKLVDMFSQGSLQGSLRYYNFQYYGHGESSQGIFPSNADAEDSVGSLILKYNTDELYGISFTSTMATAFDLWSDEDVASYAMLQNGHENLNKYMEYYTQYSGYDTTVRYGAQEIYTPLMNQDYCRILPNTYRGLSVVNRSINNTELHGYYINDFMGWTDDEYNDIGAQSGPHGLNSTITDNSLVVVGAKYQFSLSDLDLNLEGWVYNMKDVYDVQFVRAKITDNIKNNIVYFSPSVMLQHTKNGVIDNPFTIGSDDIDTYEIGFEAGIDMPSGIFAKAYYAKTGDDYQLTPFGFGKIVMQQVQVSGRRGDEDAYGLLLGYDFKENVPGLTASAWYTLYAADSNSESDLGEIEGDLTEIDYNIRYSFERVWPGPFGDAYVELGFAVIDRELDNDYEEFKFRFNLPFSIGRK